MLSHIILFVLPMHVTVASDVYHLSINQSMYNTIGCVGLLGGKVHYYINWFIFLWPNNFVARFQEVIK